MDKFWKDIISHYTTKKNTTKDTEKNKVLSQELKAQKFLSVTAPKQEKIYNKIVELDSLALQSPRFH